MPPLFSPPPPPPRPEPFELPNAVQMAEPGIWEPLLRLHIRSNPVTVDPNMDERFGGFVRGGVPGIWINDRNNQSTLIHEAAHKADQGISVDREFREAIDELEIPTISEDTNFVGPEGEDLSRFIMATSRINDFPGVRGNPKRDLGDGFMWGGYGELFAELMAQSQGDITKIPPPLRKFFVPFLGEELSRGRQADAARLTARGSTFRMANARANNRKSSKAARMFRPGE